MQSLQQTAHISRRTENVDLYLSIIEEVESFTVTVMVFLRWFGMWVWPIFIFIIIFLWQKFRQQNVVIDLCLSCIIHRIKRNFYQLSIIYKIETKNVSNVQKSRKFYDTSTFREP